MVSQFKIVTRIHFRDEFVNHQLGSTSVIQNQALRYRDSLLSRLILGKFSRRLSFCITSSGRIPKINSYHHGLFFQDLKSTFWNFQIQAVSNDVATFNLTLMKSMAGLPMNQLRIC